jgi:hypothetical protein
MANAGDKMIAREMPFTTSKIYNQKTVHSFMGY